MALRSSLYKTPAQLRAMLAPGLATAASLDAVRAAIRPGITTLELDAIAEAAIIECGGHSNFQLVPGYRHTICASVNDEVVHGIPGGRVLEPGDLVSIDSGAEIDGWNGDSAMTLVLPDPLRPEEVAARTELSRVTEGSLWRGIAVLATARHLNEVGAAIEQYIEDEAERSGRVYGILTDYIGHGIGRTMHEAPPVFNYRVRQRGPEVKPGLVVAIEPMVTAGSAETVVREDEWTVATEDGSTAAHWEHSVAVHGDGIWVTTLADGGAAGLAPYGIVPTPFA
ncbi:type I methionyl aminopeptidase [Rathayibacter rathayi]|uniref:Methionine aminopeptidase n=1 Tax=Rathayibacter rathayi TaxID=33887 RepID=A0ABD6W757_RATRA|nr:type I methionyl aminopeptidase [Rathayibacter rathayi]AZZ48062.1 type I methionyl aminopeptidase [Rathayibacter rathayi]MWV74657.1 type I methionyl aminopeptidase [Rathayibacter rathayi NCPPB 2980 = VKM Ac-1601]PPF12465.1 type I methionyl aminopeptidase [Rathayibacter rathayi]PPF25877.1 type I methionyl aminopeptidase [Rathayibacter rathayi]PPF50498.1 type I methionyl aminopeptidase [Rathayibacter rathayi]